MPLNYALRKENKRTQLPEDCKTCNGSPPSTSEGKSGTSTYTKCDGCFEILHHNTVATKRAKREKSSSTSGKTKTKTESKPKSKSFELDLRRPKSEDEGPEYVITYSNGKKTIRRADQ